MRYVNPLLTNFVPKTFPGRISASSGVALHVAILTHCLAMILPVRRQTYAEHVYFKANTVVRLHAFHQNESGLIPGGAASGFLHVGIVPNDAAGRRVFSGISFSRHPCIPVLLHSHLVGSQELVQNLEGRLLESEQQVHHLENIVQKLNSTHRSLCGVMAGGWQNFARLLPTTFHMLLVGFWLGDYVGSFHDANIFTLQQTGSSCCMTRGCIVHEKKFEDSATLETIHRRRTTSEETLKRTTDRSQECTQPNLHEIKKPHWCQDTRPVDGTGAVEDVDGIANGNANYVSSSDGASTGTSKGNIGMLVVGTASNELFIFICV
ncbi:hypothetical protein PR048_021394 [Dryococelus australis]|uniref:Uncharacterized protein n=1 Tax=Dryococelus australis TaxID=614101 RepID=A0ABQ9GY59_9NEOP|nr:hypothetical protein PR048_021394 [Dryococelus australis]